jgi:molecular chaperone DnaK (HSP70)
LLLNAQKALNVVEPIKRAVITVPAYFNADQCAATVKAGNLAGLERVKLLREPEAAAFAYGLTQREKQIILVFDLGGGTFDVSVLDVGDGFAEVIATSGDSYLGGDDFDTAIMNWIVEEYMKLPSATSPIGNVDFSTRAREEAEKAKIALSTTKEYK